MVLALEAMRQPRGIVGLWSIRIFFFYQIEQKKPRDNEWGCHGSHVYFRPAWCPWKDIISGEEAFETEDSFSIPSKSSLIQSLLHQDRLLTTSTKQLYIHPSYPLHNANSKSPSLPHTHNSQWL